MKETVVVDKEMLMKLLRAFAGNYDFDRCEFCSKNGVSHDKYASNLGSCAAEIFKKLTEVESRGEEICN